MNVVQVRRQFLYRTTQKIVEWISRYRVMSGPFQGMQYSPENIVGNALHSKYLGMYEKELHPVFKELAGTKFSKVIDIGAAEGYYVVGAALMFPNAEIFAFEADSKGQAAIREMTRLNRVESRVQVKGYCNFDDLSTVIRETDEQLLIIMDIEGGEIQLLDPERIPLLRKATILVETHDFKVPHCSEAILKRFDKSHEIQIISSCDRSYSDIPFRCPRLLSRWFIHVGSDQRSGIQDWFLLTPMTQTEG